MIEKKSELYDEIAEEFLDEVFDVESKLARHDWELAVAEKFNYIFEPEKVR